jgi:hypothetical protein
MIIEIFSAGNVGIRRRRVGGRREGPSLDIPPHKTPVA